MLKGPEWDKKSKWFGSTKGTCRNCGKKGHWVKDCWEPGGDKEGQALTAVCIIQGMRLFILKKKKMSRELDISVNFALE